MSDPRARPDHAGGHRWTAHGANVTTPRCVRCERPSVSDHRYSDPALDEAHAFGFREGYRQGAAAERERLELWLLHDQSNDMGQYGCPRSWGKEPCTCGLDAALANPEPSDD